MLRFFGFFFFFLIYTTTVGNQGKNFNFVWLNLSTIEQRNLYNILCKVSKKVVHLHASIPGTVFELVMEKSAGSHSGAAVPK